MSSVYTIGLPCDQTMQYWVGPVLNQWTFLGKEAWRTEDKAVADRMVDMMCEGLEDHEFPSQRPWVCEPQDEDELNREDWTW